MPTSRGDEGLWVWPRVCAFEAGPDLRSQKFVRPCVRAFRWPQKEIMIPRKKTFCTVWRGRSNVHESGGLGPLGAGARGRV